MWPWTLLFQHAYPSYLFWSFYMKLKFNALALLVNAAVLAFTASAMADTGPSTTTAPYLRAIAPGVELTSILTTGDNVGGYVFSGIPDGMGAYDNEDGTFTVLIGHEMYSDAKTGPVGIVRSHGGKGAFVSEWVIDKNTLAVKSGADLMKSVYQMGATGWEPVPTVAETDPAYMASLGKTTAFARFCSADLADRKAFFNSATRKGTKARIFLNGEESGPVFQRGLAHVATGHAKGQSFVLPWASNVNGAWENLVANPHSGDRTVVIGLADGGTNGVYVYVGNKAKIGNDVEKAGLIGGAVYRIAVNGNLAETQAADAGLGLLPNARGNFEGSFSLVTGDVATNAISTKFLRPEDGAWDTKNHNRFFFNTTDQMDAAKDGMTTGVVGRTRVWALTFTDSSKPELGGSIEMLLDGTSAKGDYQMFDNMTVMADGTLILQEDPGNNAHSAKVWKYNPATGTMVKLAGVDTTLFGDIDPVTGAVTTGTITKDEETSGVIDVTELLDREDDKSYSLLVVQNHKASGNPVTVEGGQLVLMVQPAPESDDGDGHDDGRDDDRKAGHK
jgi:hypothetical protein